MHTATWSSTARAPSRELYMNKYTIFLVLPKRFLYMEFCHAETVSNNIAWALQPHNQEHISMIAKHKVQLRLLAMPVLQVSGHKSMYRTWWWCEKKSVHGNQSNSCLDISLKSTNMKHMVEEKSEYLPINAKHLLVTAAQTSAVFLHFL